MSAFLLFIVAMSGCKKDENKEFTDSPIIESYLEPGNYFTIKVSRQIPFTTDVQYSSDDINNLAINVLYNNSSYLLKPFGNGNYIDSSIIVTENSKYNLSFSFNSKNVSAYTYVPYKPLNMAESVTQMSITQITASSGIPTSPPTDPDPIKITWDNTDGSYYLITVENLETTLVAIRDFGNITPPGNIFKKSPTNLNTQELRSRDFQYYGQHRIILYHVLPDYASLYDQNSTSSQNLSNPSTSIVNGYGIFTGLNSDTLYVQIKKQ